MNYTMTIRIILSVLIASWIPRSLAAAQTELRPLPAIVDFVRHADPAAKFEFCGDIATKDTTFYLFALERDAVAGFALISSKSNSPPVIVDADTSLVPFSTDLDAKVQQSVSILLRRREKERPAKLSAIGERIDEVIAPIAGIRFGTNSTRVLLHLLKRGRAYSVAPASAPPGSIIVSPTCFTSGKVAIGHAGILGFQGEIYSADARLNGSWARNYTMDRWRAEFSGTNGVYAFALRTNKNVLVQGQ
jgi:hypothetical protein